MDVGTDSVARTWSTRGDHVESKLVSNYPDSYIRITTPMTQCQTLCKHLSRKSVSRCYSSNKVTHPSRDLNVCPSFLRVGC